MTKRFCKPLFESVVLFALLGVAPAWGADAQLTALRFGSVVTDTASSMQKKLLPFTAYLSEALGRPVVLHSSSTMSGAIEALATDQVDFAFFTPFAYVEANRRAKSVLVAKAVAHGQSALKLVIITRDDSRIKAVSDLAGKRFAFGDSAALMQRAVVVDAGMPLERLGTVAFLGHGNNAVRAVLTGDYDAGIVSESVANVWKDKGLRVLHSSQYLPPFNISASRNVDVSTLSALKDALLKLNVANPEHKKAVYALGDAFTGFANVDDAEYDAVRRMTKPFKK